MSTNYGQPQKAKPANFQQEIAAAKKAGLPVRPEDLRVPMPPPDL